MDNLIGENVKMKSLLCWFFDYIETSIYNEKSFYFPNVVIELTEDEVKEMKKIIEYEN